MSRHSLRLVAAIAFIAAGCAKGGDKQAATTADSMKAMAPAPAATKGVAITANEPAIAKVEAHAEPAAAPAAKTAPAKKKAAAPKGTTPATGVGKGSLAVTTVHKPGEQAEVTQEPVDFEGKGAATADVGVDNYSHVVFAYAVEEETCKDGTVVKGAELMAVYGPHNSFNQPVGSGWYAAELTAGECGARESTIWGARFDANGNITAEGFATIDPKTNDLVIVAAQDSAAAPMTPAAPATAPAPAKKP